MLLWISGTAFLVKAWILFASRKATHGTGLFLYLVLAFACLNVAEFTSLLQLKSADDWLLRVYYVTTVWCLMLMCVYAAQVSRKLDVALVAKLALPAALCLTMIILFTDFVISGVTSLGYTRTATKGVLYIAYPAFAIACLSFVAVVLLTGFYRGRAQLVKMQSKYCLIAFTPIIISGIIIAILMNVGFKVNAVGILPWATTFFLFIILLSEDVHKLSGLRFTQAMHASSRGELSNKEFKNEIERIRLEHELHVCSNVSQIARNMKVARSTVYDIAERTGICLSDYKL